jgi:hypothetical protein
MAHFAAPFLAISTYIDGPRPTANPLAAAPLWATTEGECLIRVDIDWGPAPRRRDGVEPKDRAPWALAGCFAGKRRPVYGEARPASKRRRSPRSRSPSILSGGSFAGRRGSSRRPRRRASHRSDARASCRRRLGGVNLEGSGVVVETTDRDVAETRPLRRHPMSDHLIQVCVSSPKESARITSLG